MLVLGSSLLLLMVKPRMHWCLHLAPAAGLPVAEAALNPQRTLHPEP